MLHMTGSSYELMASELGAAEIEIFKIAQNGAFGSERAAIQRKQLLPDRSRLSSLMMRAHSRAEVD